LSWSKLAADSRRKKSGAARNLEQTSRERDLLEMNLENSVGTTKITKDTNMQMVTPTAPFTRRVNAPAGNLSLLLADFVLFVVSFNCGI